MMTIDTLIDKEKKLYQQILDIYAPLEAYQIVQLGYRCIDRSNKDYEIWKRDTDIITFKIINTNPRLYVKYEM